MNIVFVSSEFPLSVNEPTGGIGTYLINLIKGLVQNGHNITVLTRSNQINNHKNIRVIKCNFGVNIIEKIIQKNKISFINRLLNFISYPILFSLEVFFRLRKLNEIDIIEGNDFGGELFFYLLFKSKKPVTVIRLHTPSFVIQKYNNEKLTLFYRIINFIEKYCLKKVDYLYSPTKSLSQLIYQEIKRKVNTIIPYPFISPKDPKVTRKNNVILYVGKLQIKKGVFTIIKSIPLVLKKFPKAKFYFIGPDTIVTGESIKLELIKESRLLNIEKSIVFLPFLDKSIIYRYYAQATMLLIPSFWENFPNVCLEAMSLKCPVIAANRGGLTEILKDGYNAELFNPYNHNQLANKIIQLLSNKNLRRKLTRIAEKSLQKYRVSRIINLTANYYRKIYNH